MSERKDEGIEEPKRLIYFDQFDPLLFVAILLVVGPLVFMFASVTPRYIYLSMITINYWPNNFKAIVDISYTILLIVGGALTLTFAGIRLQHSARQTFYIARESKRKDEEQLARFYTEAIQMFCGDNLKFVELGMLNIEDIARNHPKKYLQITISTLCRMIADPKRIASYFAQNTRRKFDTIQTTISLIQLYEEFFESEPEFELKGVNFDEIRFQNMTIRSKSFRGSIFSRAIFQNCVFKGYFADVDGQDGDDPSLELYERSPERIPADLLSYDLEERSRGKCVAPRGFNCASFYECDFSQAEFPWRDFRQSRFLMCELGASNFYNCNFENSIICNSLMNKDLEGIIFEECSFQSHLDMSDFNNLVHDNIFSDSPSKDMLSNFDITGSIDIPVRANKFKPSHFKNCTVFDGKAEYLGFRSLAVNLDYETVNGETAAKKFNVVWANGKTRKEN